MSGVYGVGLLWVLRHVQRKGAQMWQHGVRQYLAVFWHKVDVLLVGMYVRTRTATIPGLPHTRCSRVPRSG